MSGKRAIKLADVFLSKTAAVRGCDVRLLYDGIGSMDLDDMALLGLAACNAGTTRKGGTNYLHADIFY